MSQLIAEREQALAQRLDQMRANQEWLLFQNFVLGLLPHDGYNDVRLSAVKNDFGCDAVALTPDGKKCFIAVSFNCSVGKVRSDAKRWTEDPNREDAEVMLFVTCESPQKTTVSTWVGEIKGKRGLELRLYNRNTILSTATRPGVWRRTCDQLGIARLPEGYVKVSPYDADAVRQALNARPPEWLRQRVRLTEWEQLTPTVHSRLIFGRPGSGKTTTIFEQLQLARPETVLVVERDLNQPAQVEGLLDDATGGAVIVFDDLHEKPDQFATLCQALWKRRHDPPPIAQRYAQVSLLAATRGKEWEDVRRKLPLTILKDVGLLDGTELTLTGLDVEQCRRLIEICCAEWDLVIEERLASQGAQVAAERDATPLYVISMLAGVKALPDQTLRDAHLVRAPRDVRGWWELYWRDLDPASQGVLRLVRLFWAAAVPPQPQLLLQAVRCCGISPARLTPTLDALERSLWLTRSGGVPTCLDAQLEAIDLDPATYELWEQFLRDIDAGAGTVAQLHNGTGAFYYQHAAPRAATNAEYHQRLVEAARHFETVGSLGGPQDQITAAMALNNASVCYSALAGLETTRDGRRAWLDKAVAAVEESVRIYRELGVRGDLAMSLNNASNRYSALAGLETTRDGRRAWLDKAVAAVEEAVRIYRELGVRGDLAGSLNNASNRYSDLAGLETTRDGRRAWLDKAVAAVEESIVIRRELGLRGGLASSLNNASNLYSALAGLETTRDGRRAWLDKAVAAVEESITIRRQLGVRGDLASSLNNASNLYSALAGLETTRDGRRAWLDKAVAAVEEAVRVDRELGVRGDLASSLNNASNLYSALAGLETTRDGRRAWLDKAVAAVEESVRIYRELGVRGDLAMSLNNASNLYRALAGLETTRDGRRAWLDKAVAAVEESVRIYRELGVRGDLASSLNNASNLYSALAGLETTRDGRRAWLDKAVAAVEEAVRVDRELGVRGDLAMSLGSLCQHERSLAETETDPEEVARRLVSSRAAIDEAVGLFRHAGNTPYLLLSLQHAVTARLLQAEAGATLDVEDLTALVDEGLALAKSMQDEHALGFFTDLKQQLTKGAAQ